MATTFVAPNLFQLSGKTVHVNYSISGIDGKPHLHYQDSQHNLNISGNEIRTVSCDLGTVVSVTIQGSIDSGSTTFSVLIPRSNLNGGEIGHIRTDGVMTIHRFSIVPTLNHGQLDHYTVTPLHGTARSVVF